MSVIQRELRGTHKEVPALCLSFCSLIHPSIHLLFHLPIDYLVFIAYPSSFTYPCIPSTQWSAFTVRELKTWNLMHVTEKEANTHFTSGHGSLWSGAHEVLWENRDENSQLNKASCRSRLVK